MAVAFKEKMGKRKVLCAIVCNNGGNHVISPEKTCRSEGNDFGSHFQEFYTRYMLYSWKNSKLNAESPDDDTSFWLCFFTAIETGIFSVLIRKSRVAGSLQETISLNLFSFLFHRDSIGIVSKRNFFVWCSNGITTEYISTVDRGCDRVDCFKEKMTLKLGIGILLILFSTVLVALPVKEKKRI